LPPPALKLGELLRRCDLAHIDRTDVAQKRTGYRTVKRTS